MQKVGLANTKSSTKNTKGTKREMGKRKGPVPLGKWFKEKVEEQCHVNADGQSQGKGRSGMSKIASASL